MNFTGQGNHPCVDGFKNVLFQFARILLQQCVSVHQQFVVGNQVVQIHFVILGNDAVDEPAAGITAKVDDVAVGRGDDDKRVRAYVIRQAVIFLPVFLEHFFVPQFHAAHQLIGRFIPDDIRLDHQIVFPVPDVLRIHVIKVTFAERKIVQCVQNIGLAAAVIPHIAVNAGRKRNGNGGVILEILQ